LDRWSLRDAARKLGEVNNRNKRETESIDRRKVKTGR
jgi:hypothetical protein